MYSSLAMVGQGSTGDGKLGFPSKINYQRSERTNVYYLVSAGMGTNTSRPSVLLTVTWMDEQQNTASSDLIYSPRQYMSDISQSTSNARPLGRHATQRLILHDFVTSLANHPFPL